MRRTTIEKGMQSLNPRINRDFKAETTKEAWICLRSLKVWVEEMQLACQDPSQRTAVDIGFSFHLSVAIALVKT
jgi:hypothetical protein